MGTAEGPGGEHPIVVLNLSASGAMIQAHEAPEDGSEYLLCFSINKQSYELRFQVIHCVQQGDTFGWRGPFIGVTPEQDEAIDRAVQAAAGTATSSLRGWEEVLADARRQPAAKVNVGMTPAGHDIAVGGQDVIDMGPDGLELYARLMCELETI